MIGLDTPELWLLITLGLLFVLWLIVELVDYVDRHRPMNLEYTRQQEAARKRWAEMLEQSCFYQQRKEP